VQPALQGHLVLQVVQDLLVLRDARVKQGPQDQWVQLAQLAQLAQLV